MTRPTAPATLAGVLAAALALLVACTPTTAAPVATPPPTPTPSPTPTHRAQTHAPAEPTTVLATDDAVELALATSRALFDRAPVVVVATAGDAAQLERAARRAVELGVPVLLLPAAPAPGPEAPAAPEVPPSDGASSPAAPMPEARSTPASPTSATPPAPAGPAPEALPGPASPELDAELRRLATVAVLDLTDRFRTTSGARVVTGSGPGEATDDTDPLPPTEPPDPRGEVVVLTTGAPEQAAAVATARAAGAQVVTSEGDPRGDPAAIAALAAVADGAPPEATLALGTAFGTAEDLAWRVRTAATGVELPGGGQVLFPGRRLVALYGHPDGPALGVLGEQDVPGSVARARALADHYQGLTGDVVVPAFEIIATVASAGAGEDGQYSRRTPVAALRPLVDAARDSGTYVVLDLQPGRTDFLTQARYYEELLREPHVGLALDPEWRLLPHQVHLRQIGSVGIDEVNATLTWLADLTREAALPQKLLILHQFQQRMIAERERLDTSRTEVAVLIHADGQGSQPAKQATWAALRRDAPPGVWWGWKNFHDEDVPMLTPEQTYAGVEPVPDFVSYQ